MNYPLGKFLLTSDLPLGNQLSCRLFLSNKPSLVVLACLFLTGLPVAAEEIAPNDVMTELSLPNTPNGQDEKRREDESFLDRQRLVITNQFVDLSEALDRLISNKPSADKNHSYMVLDVDSVFVEGGERSFNLRARAKVDLPNTKNRFKIIFESDPEDDFSPQENELAGITADDKIEPERAVAAVEYTKHRKQFEWQPSFDIGARFEFPIDLFTRLRLQKTSLLGENWVLFSRLELPYYAREGARPSARFTFERGVSESLAFKTVSRYKYTEETELHETYQSFQLNHVWRQDTSIEYKMGAFGNSEIDHPVDHYFVQIAFKKRIYRDWMYISFIPQIIFPYEDDWSPKNAFTLNIQSFYAQ